MITLYLHRGLAAGLVAGMLAGVFAFFFGESPLEEAIQLEVAASGGAPEEEGFSRSTQKVGLFFATGLSGMALGGLFGLAYTYFRDRLASESDRERSLTLAAVMFIGAILLPFLKYPANPPTIGDPATVGTRTAAYFTMVILSLLAILTAWSVVNKLRERGMNAPVRQTVVGAGLMVVLAGLFIGLPAAADTGGFPAGLLWDFRVRALGTQLVLWTSLGVVFGWLCERANRPSQKSSPADVTAPGR